MKFLALTQYLLARITLTLISSSDIIFCFQKVNFQGFNLVILNFEFSSAILVCVSELFEKQSVSCKKYSVLVQIRENLLCVTNRCIKITGKLILPSVSRFKLCPHYKSRVKQICIKCKSIKVSHKTIYNVRTILWNSTVCSYHVTYTFQSKSTLSSCLNVKELLAQNRREI